MISPEQQILNNLETLRHNPEFISFQKDYIKPLIDSLENDLKVTDEMPEVVLRAKLKHYFSLKKMYFEVFEDVIRARENK